jgi:hypothetical protein
MNTIAALLLLQDPGIAWMDDYEEALKAARDSRRNLVLHFTTSR